MIVNIVYACANVFLILLFDTLCIQMKSLR